MSRRKRLQRSELLIVVLGLLYIVSPVDLVPEIVAGPLGLTDDLAAAVLIARTLILARSRAPIDQTGSEPS